MKRTLLLLALLAVAAASGSAEKSDRTTKSAPVQLPADSAPGAADAAAGDPEPAQPRPPAGKDGGEPPEADGNVIVVAPEPDPAAPAKGIALDKALDSLRRQRAKGETAPAVIEFTPGIYYTSLTIDPELAGEGLTLRAAKRAEGKVTLSAGMPVKGWEEAGKNLWRAKADHPEIAQFFVKGNLRKYSRAPNTRFWPIRKAGPDRRTSFTVPPNTVPPVEDVSNLQLVFFHDWSVSRVPVKSFDPASRTLTTVAPVGAEPPYFAMNHFEPQPRFFLAGARSFLDSRGEWHFDRSSRTLTYWPLPTERPDTIEARIPVKPHVLALRGTKERPLRNINIEGLIIANAHYPAPPAGYAGIQATLHEKRPGPGRMFVPASIMADYCRDTRLYNCIVTDSDNGGLWIRSGCRDVAVEYCTFRQLGGNGIMIGTPGEEKPVTRNIRIRRVLVDRCGTRFPGAVGIWIGMAADCVVERNELRHLPYSGISLGWRWDDTPTVCRGHRVELNRIRSVMKLLSDGGGIYTLGAQPGTVLRENQIHDIAQKNGRAESNGLFMDEGSSGILVEDNNFRGIRHSLIRFHKAGKNTLRGNKFETQKGVPALRFQATPESNITVEN